MELRQLRYFVRVAELGSMGRAAADLGVVTSALSQQISRLESELATRLLVRSAAGVSPTDAGLAFLRQAQLALRHADDAVLAAHRLVQCTGFGFDFKAGQVLGQRVQRVRHAAEHIQDVAQAFGGGRAGDFHLPAPHGHHFRDHHLGAVAATGGWCRGARNGGSAWRTQGAGVRRGALGPQCCKEAGQGQDQPQQGQQTAKPSQGATGQHQGPAQGLQPSGCTPMVWVSGGWLGGSRVRSNARGHGGGCAG